LIKENISFIRERIAAACQRAQWRSGIPVKIVAVSKGSPLSQVREAAEAGITDVGENRVREALTKFRECGELDPELLSRLKWHMVGHLQTNKAGDAVTIFDSIHSVDSFRIAQEIDSCARAAGKSIELLIEVNISGEESKHGVRPEEALELCRQVYGLHNVSLNGLMTIAPYSADREHARPFFRGLRELRDSINSALSTPGGLPVLSMGMTQDFETAVEEGATVVRIGRGIFGTPSTGAVEEVRES